MQGHGRETSCDPVPGLTRFAVSTNSSTKQHSCDWFNVQFVRWDCGQRFPLMKPSRFLEKRKLNPVYPLRSRCGTLECYGLRIFTSARTVGAESTEERVKTKLNSLQEGRRSELGTFFLFDCATVTTMILLRCKRHTAPTLAGHILSWLPSPNKLFYFA